MLVDEIDLPRGFLEIIKEEGITELYPPQSEAMPHVEQGKNVLMAVPTAAGKSLVAYVGALRGVLKGGKTLYIVPLRALAWEKIEELRKFEKLGIKVGVSLGDYDSSSNDLAHCQIIVATAEKADSLLRHRVKWLNEVNVVVGDEVHLIQDARRGPTMEVILARFRSLPQDIQIIALSATIPNSNELAEWLRAVHIKSDWRPVELRSFVYHDRMAYYPLSPWEIGSKDTGFPRCKKGEEEIIIDSVKKDFQCLVFVNARNRAVSLARKMGPITEKWLKECERTALHELSVKLLKSERETTDIARELAELIGKGTSYHHAGLTDPMRKIVEKGFKSGLLKIIAATPTLAAGVNLPARRVIIRDTYRYEGMRGMVPVPVLEVKQMCGRAGRPGYDDEGEAFIISSSPERVEGLMDRYLCSDGELIQSKLGAEGALRIHILASVASGFVTDIDSLETFIDSTLYAHQSDSSFMKEQISETIDFLLKFDFIKYMDERGDFQTEELDLYGCRKSTDEIGFQEGKAINNISFQEEKSINNISFQEEKSINNISFQEEKSINDSGFENAFDSFRRDENRSRSTEKIRFYPTEFGLRTSRLYVDPMSALNLRNALGSMEKRDGTEITALCVLHAVCSCPDMNPLYLRKADKQTFSVLYFRNEKDFLFDPPLNPHEFEFFLSEIKTASLIHDWMNELAEDAITKKYNIGPGDIRGRVELGEWLLYTMKELAILFNNPHIVFLEKLLSRIRSGIKEELLDLVTIRDVGRVRSRALYDAGFKDRASLAGADVKELLGIHGIGKILAEKIIRDTKQ